MRSAETVWNDTFKCSNRVASLIQPKSLIPNKRSKFRTLWLGILAGLALGSQVGLSKTMFVREALCVEGWLASRLCSFNLDDLSAAQMRCVLPKTWQAISIAAVLPLWAIFPAEVAGEGAFVVCVKWLAGSPI